MHYHALHVGFPSACRAVMERSLSCLQQWDDWKYVGHGSKKPSVNISIVYCRWMRFQVHNQLARPAFVQQDYFARKPINKEINLTEWWAPQANVRYLGILDISKTCQWELEKGLGGVFFVLSMSRFYNGTWAMLCFVAVMQFSFCFFLSVLSSSITVMFCPVKYWHLKKTQSYTQCKKIF